MSRPTTLKPFWSYYGGKWRIANKYPSPQHDSIVEPFAGAAGYSLRHYSRQVILVEKYRKVAEVWRWLIAASEEDVSQIPLVDAVSDLPHDTPDGARWLVGFSLNAGNVAPAMTLSAGLRRHRSCGRRICGWSDARRDRVASQVKYIKHWRVMEGDYTMADNAVATWFVDPPYQGRAGSYYKASVGSYTALAQWCASRRGQVIVCEGHGATWLPFRPLVTSHTFKGTYQEHVWP